MVSAVLVDDDDDIMLMTDLGMLVRTKVNQVRETGRAAQGVKLINLKENEKLVVIQQISNDDEDEDVSEANEVQGNEIQNEGNAIHSVPDQE